MKIFVGEYVCGGGVVDSPLEQVPLELRREGAAMLRAITQDIAEMADVVVSLDERFDVDIAGAESIPAKSGQSIFSAWINAAKNCDAALIVAPESDGILAKAVSVMRAAGVDVIASSGDFLRVASDKLQTAKVLHSAGVSHPIYMANSDLRFESQMKGYDRYVLKPRDGCGTQEIQVVQSLDEAKSKLTDDLLLQPWMPGNPISVALVASGNHQTFLPAVSQKIQIENGSYEGGCGPLDDDAQRRATALAARAIAAMPMTARGFVGLDLLLGRQASEDCVIEVNPRLTTSYVGLRQMINGNLAARLFDMETGAVSCSVTVNSVSWAPDGKVRISDGLSDKPPASCS